MSADVELGEAGGLAYRSAGSGRPLVLVASCTDGSDAPPPGDPPGSLDGLPESAAAAVGYAWERELRATTPEALAGVTVLAIAGEYDRYRPVVARRLEETEQ